MRGRKRSRPGLRHGWCYRTLSAGMTDGAGRVSGRVKQVGAGVQGRCFALEDEAAGEGSG